MWAHFYCLTVTHHKCSFRKCSYLTISQWDAVWRDRYKFPSLYTSNQGQHFQVFCTLLRVFFQCHAMPVFFLLIVFHWCKSFAAMWAETWCMNSIMQVYFLRVWTQNACNNKETSHAHDDENFTGVSGFYHPWSVGYAQVIPAKVNSSWWSWPIVWKICTFVFVGMRAGVLKIFWINNPAGKKPMS